MGLRLLRICALLILTLPMVHASFNRNEGDRGMLNIYGTTLLLLVKHIATINQFSIYSMDI